MTNPFEYGTAVSGAAFCNRTKESADLINAINSSLRIFLYSERMMGKTSLVLRVLDDLSPRKYIAAYVDLWATDGEATFITATAKSISESMGSDATRVLETARRFFARLSPTLSLDDEGRPKLGFDYNPTAGQTRRNLEEVLAVPARIAKDSGKKVVIVFDELQRILEYGDDHVERLLRAIIQTQKNVSYIFLGSQKHLLQAMFLDRKRPLYSAATHYPIGPIAVKHWLPFISGKFQTTGKRIGDKQIERICEATEGHPFYTQHLCHAVWEQTAPMGNASFEDIKKGQEILLTREAAAFSTLWESLTINQRRFLRGLAIENQQVSPYGAAFLERYGLSNSSAVQRITSALMRRDVIDRDGTSFVISDRFLRLWIRGREE